MFSTQNLSIVTDSCRLLAHETSTVSAFCNSDSSTGPVTFTYNLTSSANNFIAVLKEASTQARSFKIYEKHTIKQLPMQLHRCKYMDCETLLNTRRRPYVRPHLEYCVQLWSPSLSESSQGHRIIKRIQRQDNFETRSIVFLFLQICHILQEPIVLLYLCKLSCWAQECVYLTWFPFPRC